jgi:hypothetical protein
VSARAARGGGGRAAQRRDLGEWAGGVSQAARGGRQCSGMTSARGLAAGAR